MFRKPQHLAALDDEITNILRDMHNIETGSDRYNVLVAKVNELHALRKTFSQNATVSPDTFAIVTANLLGIAMILHHEKVNVVASKAVSFVQKLK